MAIGTRDYARPYAGRNWFPGGLKMLLIANTAVFLLQWALGNSTTGQWFFDAFALYPYKVVTSLFVWQVATYLFLHGGIWHILFNMLALWMFGRELEEVWGKRRFLQFYFFCGIGAGLMVVLANYLVGTPGRPTIGASGAIYGVLLASAVLWPDRIIYFNFLFPIKMKYFVAIYGAIAFLSLRNLNSDVSNVAHLSGMLWGYVFLKVPRVRKFDPLGKISEQYREWKLARAKRRFQVYLRKHQGSDRDRTIH